MSSRQRRFLLVSSCSPRSLSLPAGLLFPPRDGRGNYHYARFKGVGERCGCRVCVCVCAIRAYRLLSALPRCTHGCGVCGQRDMRNDKDVRVAWKRGEARYETIDERLNSCCTDAAIHIRASRSPLIFGRGPTARESRSGISPDNTMRRSEVEVTCARGAETAVHEPGTRRTGGIRHASCFPESYESPNELSRKPLLTWSCVNISISNEYATYWMTIE